MNKKEINFIQQVIISGGTCSTARKRYKLSCQDEQKDCPILKYYASKILGSYCYYKTVLPISKLLLKEHKLQELLK